MTYSRFWFNTNWKCLNSIDRKKTKTTLKKRGKWSKASRSVSVGRWCILHQFTCDLHVAKSCICYFCVAYDLDLVESLFFCIRIAWGVHLVEFFLFFWIECGWHITKSWFAIFVLHEIHTLRNSASAMSSVVCTLHVVWTLRNPALLSLHCMFFKTESGYEW